jgi:hypothetical protein
MNILDMALFESNGWNATGGLRKAKEERKERGSRMLLAANQRQERLESLGQREVVGVGTR